MSIIEQALRKTTVPVQHKLLNTIDLSYVDSRAIPETTYFHFRCPGYRLVQRNVDMLEALAYKPERRQEFLDRFNGIIHDYRLGGFPHEDPELYETIDDVEKPTWSVERTIKALRELNRDTVIQLVAPLFIYSRSRIVSGWQDDNLFDGEFVVLSEITDETPLVEIEQVKDEDTAEELVNKFTILTRNESCGMNRVAVHVGWSGEFLYNFDFRDTLATTSTGILFDANGPLIHDAFDIVDTQRPSDPYAAYTPNVTHVAARLLQELQAQSDMTLIVIALNLLTGVSAHGDHDPNGTFLNVRGEPIWDQLFPAYTQDDFILKRV